MKHSLSEILTATGRVLMRYFGLSHDVTIKNGHGSIVTEADFQAEKTILAHLEAHHPDHNILSEEMGYRDNGSSITWVIDPLDGTSNFAASLPWFCTIIAVFQEDTPLLGGVYLPATDELFLAAANEPSTLNGHPIRVAGDTALKHALVSFSTDYAGDDSRVVRDMFITGRLMPRVRNLRSINCGVEYCYTAAGRLGGCVNMVTRIWDIAAPWLILKGAAGTLTDLDGRDPVFSFDAAGREREYSVVGGHPELVRQLRNAIGDLHRRTFHQFPTLEPRS